MLHLEGHGIQGAVPLLEAFADRIGADGNGHECSAQLDGVAVLTSSCLASKAITVQITQ